MPASGNYQPISFDPFTALPYGLLSVASPVAPTSAHWQAGVTWEPICALGGTTFMPCVTGGTAIVPPTKAATFEHLDQGARPYTVITEVDCSPPGFWDDAETEVLTALTRVEQFQMERVLWTGDAGGQHVVYPNLTTVGPVTDGEILLQPTGTLISGAALDIVEALGRLEAALVACYPGVGVIHVPTILLAALCAHGLAYEDGGKLHTKNGNLIAVGGGYLPFVGPNGAAAPAGSAWMVATGPVFYIRGTPRVTSRSSALNRSINTLAMIAERTVITGYNCCRISVLTTIGGEPTGTPGS